jgi:anti-sigma B factor antagonist
MISSTHLDPQTLHLTVRGRLDLDTSPELRRRLQEAGQQGVSHILLSLGELEFMDSSGLSALVSGLKTARQAGGELSLIAPSSAVYHLLELTLLDRVIPIVPSLGAAYPRRG